MFEDLIFLSARPNAGARTVEGRVIRCMGEWNTTKKIERLTLEADKRKVFI